VPPKASKPDLPVNVYLVPCSCGTTFSVAPGYDQHGSRWSRFLACPNCDKKHDPRNRVLRLGYRSGKFWTVDDC